MAGKIDEWGTVWRGEGLELVGMEIWMGPFHVADIRPEVGRGARLSQVKALLENAREGMLDEEWHASEMSDLREALNSDIDAAKEQCDELQRELYAAHDEIAQLQARKTK